MNKIEYALSHATDTKVLMLGKGVIIKAGEQVKMLLDNSGISQDEPFIISDNSLFAERTSGSIRSSLRASLGKCARTSGS
jgi:hypothetical protein